MAFGKKTANDDGNTQHKTDLSRRKTTGFGPRLYATFSWLAVSSATFAALTVPRRKEWVDICLDYMYLKRAQYEPNVYQAMGRFLRRLAK